MAYRPLGLVREMLASMGLELTYAYDDLVFVSHNAFLLQFDDAGETVGLRVNSDCPAGEVDGLVASAVRAGAGVGLAVVMRGRYETTSNGRDDSFSLRFI
jgi:hypothetical protein